MALPKLPSETNIEAKYVYKFIACSLFGMLSFMLPVPIFDGKTLVGFVSNILETHFDTALTYFVCVVILLSAALSVWAQFSRKNERLKKYRTTLLYLLTKIIAAFISVCFLFQMNIEFITSAQIGGSMLHVCQSIVTISISLGVVLPFLTNSGVMEFFGTLTQNLMTPLFRVPSIAAIDIMTSWFGASNAEVLLCREKYRKGYYSKRDAATIMCNFSMVSMSFVYVVAEVVGLQQQAFLIFVLACVISVILAIVMPRIEPLKSIRQDYMVPNQVVDVTVPVGMSRWQWGLYLGAKQAQRFSVRQLVREAGQLMVSIWLDLLPTILAWGTIGLILVYHTAFFSVISYPVGVLLLLAGIEEPFVAASAILVGYVDMFIPVILGASITAVRTKFMVTLLSLVPMIYLTEVGAVILQSDIDIDLRKLTIIYLERVILAFPLVYLCTWLVYGA